MKMTTKPTISTFTILKLLESASDKARVEESSRGRDTGSAAGCFSKDDSIFSGKSGRSGFVGSLMTRLPLIFIRVWKINYQNYRFSASHSRLL